LAENEMKKSLNKFDPWVSMVRLSRWLCQGNVFVLIFDLVQHVVPFFAVATDTITSCSLGRQYGPVFSLSFLDVYGNAKHKSQPWTQIGLPKAQGLSRDI
jgi:hypothetical protein